MSVEVELPREEIRADDLALRIRMPALTIGVLALVASVAFAFVSRNAESFFRGYLTSYCFMLSLALGSLFFVLLQHLTRAGWSVAVRRVAEQCMAALPVLAVMSLVIVVPLILGVPKAIQHVYPWADPDEVAHSELLQHKQPYLNVPFFVIRMVIYFAVWCGLAHYFYSRSVRQDETGDEALTLAMRRVSAPGMIAFGLTLTFASFDLMMSLTPTWYSTIFGVYYFSGSTLGFLAVLVLVIYALQGARRLEHVVSVEHYHDLGKLAFGFVVFWAYIAYSQYMLIWYGNMPEETAWYFVRQQSPWLWISLLLLFGHFMLPFVGLISRYPKRRPGILAIAAAYLLVMHWFDVLWLVMPHAVHEQAQLVVAPLTAVDVVQCLLTLVGLAGLCMWAVAGKMASSALVPQRDPRLADSLAFENV